MLSEFLVKKLHISWILTFGSIAFLLGVVASLKFRNFDSIEWLVMSLCLLIVSCVKPSIMKVISVVIGGLLLGLYRGGVELEVRSGLEQYINETVIVEGFVSDDPTIALDGDTRLVVDVASIDNDEISAELWVSAPQVSSQLPDIKRSDTVRFQGRIEPGFGTFEGAVYKAELLSIVRTPYIDIARDVRDDFASHVSEQVTSPESDLGNGFLLGTKSRLPEKLDQDLRMLGLTHIVVASGYNLTILVRLSRRVMMRISRFAAFAGSVGLVIAFAHVTGWSPSMTRAAMITLLSLITWYYGRKAHPFTLLSIVAAASVFLKPSYAWGDIGWLLSFLSFTGVIILSPMLHLYFWGDTAGNTVRQILIETFSAQLLTAPLIIFVFGQYSPLALVANLIVLPLIPLAMFFTFIAGVSGYLSLGFLNTLIALPAQVILSYMVRAVEWLSQFPIAKQEISLFHTGLIIIYILMVMFMIFLYKRTDYRLGEYNVIE